MTNQEIRSGAASGERVEEIAEAWQRTSPGFDPGLFRAVSEITLISAHIEDEFRQFANSAYNMGPGDLRIVLALLRGPVSGLSQVELERSLLITSGGVAKQVARLEERGFIRRQRHADGRRGWNITLSEAGRAACEANFSKHGAEVFPVFYPAFQALAPDARRAGMAFLKHLLDTLSKH
jgi:DNA-binding MarR family transcriptional regulator